MDVEGWTKLLVALGVVLAGLRWLIRVYVVQQKKILIAQSEAHKAQLHSLEIECDSLKKEMFEHRAKLSQFEVRTEHVVTLFEETQKGFGGLSAALKSFVTDTNDRHKVAAQRLDNLEVLTQRLGKVILKKN
jgi:hypothetical protein